MSTQKHPPDEGPAGKARLLLSAMRLFGERGFDGVSVREIATDAGVSVGLIKHHYGSKAGLRQAVDEYFIGRFEAFYGNSERPVENLRGGEVIATVDAWVASVADEWPVFSRYFRRALLEQTDWGAALFQRYFDLVRASIERLDAQGRLRSDVDRLWLPFLFIFLETGTLLLDPYIESVLGRSGYEPDLWKRRYRAYGDMIARGVMVPSRGKSS
ncbi:MAG: TetR/AcrR family transcriptional regulator [Pseudomonadales bacterium]|nr:TetR/AcrR family transcriptional regulator [Pseudomonadales bacterium]MCP5183926.1 TetR/AcrR family transcriptional regulator [Pseudomonadales bacterium]